MYDYPIEIKEIKPQSTCPACEGLTADGEFCSVECMETFARNLSVTYVLPTNDADRARKEAAMYPTKHPDTPYEGVELDVSMEQAREYETKHDWASRQARATRNNFKKIRLIKEEGNNER